MLTGVLPDTFEVIAQQESGELTEGDWLWMETNQRRLRVQVVRKLSEDMENAICALRCAGDSEGLKIVRTIPARIYSA
jgi:hypothetical protein